MAIPGFSPPGINTAPKPGISGVLQNAPPQPGLIDLNQQKQTTAPSGYEWDPIQQKYIRTGTSIGVHAGQAIKGLMSQVPGMFGPNTSSYSSLSSGMSMPQAPNFSSMSMGAPPPFQGTNPTAVMQIQAPDTTPAQTAAFNRAKDQQGEITRSAISGLQGSLAGRGMLGSGLEGRETSRIVGQGAGELGNLTREQAIQSVNQAQKNAELAYTGGIQQRGQDIGANEAAGQLGLEAWKTQAQTAQSANELALQKYQAQIAAWNAQRQAQAQGQSTQQQSLTGLLNSLNLPGY